VADDSSRPLTERGVSRVLYSFPHRLGSPGIGTTALHQIRGAIDSGLDVTIACTSLAAPVEGACRVLETMSIRGRRVPHRTMGVERAYRYHDRRVARLLRGRGDGQFDVVHCWPLGGLRTLLAAREVGVAGVRELPNTHTAVAYELAAREAAAMGITMPRGYSHRPDSRRLAVEEEEYEAATALLAPSPFVARTVAERAPRARVIRHRYGYDPSRFPAPPAAPVDRPFTVSFVGTGEPRKGLHYALEAWHGAGLDEGSARFLVCGWMYPDYRAHLGPLLDHPSVRQLPFTDDVGGVLRASDVLVLASVEEGSALVTYEAQASGCALLVSDASGAMFEHGVHGFEHAAGDVATLTRQLGELARRPELRARMRAAVLARRQELSWAEAARRLVAAYDEARAS